MNEKEKPADQLANKKDSTHKESKLKKFVSKHKVTVSLTVLILIILLGAFIKIALMENDFKKQKQAIISSYTLKLDSLNSDRLLLTAKTFSWAIRSERLRGNNEQIDQFFDDFIKNPDIVKLQLINPETSTVELSTDKKDVGTIISVFNSIDEQELVKDSTGFYIITPINGLNKKIGVFVMQARKTSY